MLEINTIRYATDLFGLFKTTETQQEDGTTTQDDKVTVAPFNRTALLEAKAPLDCSDVSEVTKILIEGVQPADTNRRLIFKIDGELKYFNGTTLADYTGDGKAADILKSGNTPAQLNALENITAFVGKKIYPIIALEQSTKATDPPTIKLSLQTRISSDTLTRTVNSLAYDLTDDTTGELPHISDITADIETTGSASVTVTVRLREKSGWSSFMSLAEAANHEASAVQFRFVYKVTAIGGSDSVTVKQITVKHTLGKAIIAGNYSDIILKAQDYEVPLQSAYVLVRHDPLQDAVLEGHVSFMKPPDKRELIQLGTANGAQQDFILGVDGAADERIDASTIELFVDSVPLNDFNFNTQTGTVTLSAKSGAAVYASYQYGREQETWRTCTLEGTYPYNDEAGTYCSRFSYKLSDDEAGERTLSSARVFMRKLEGTVAAENLGKATGSKQMFVLKHKPIASTIQFTENVSWSYDESSEILTLTARKNTALSVAYSWSGVAPVVYFVAAGFAVA